MKKAGYSNPGITRDNSGTGHRVYRHRVYRGSFLSVLLSLQVGSLFVNRCLHFRRNILGDRLHSVVFSSVLSNLSHHLVIIFPTRNEVAVQANGAAFHNFRHD